jgi:hypothetical protein
MLTVLQGGLSPLRGPSASRKAEHSIGNIDARRKHQPTDALEEVEVSIYGVRHLLAYHGQLFRNRIKVGLPTTHAGFT